MDNGVTTSFQGDRIVELVGSGVSVDEDGNVFVSLVTEDEKWTPEHGLLMTGYDLLALRDVLGEAEDLVARSVPQAFVRLMIYKS